MGFFDALFGSEKPQAKPKRTPKAVVEQDVVEQEDAGISPEIIAVISAAAYASYSDEIIAVISAAVYAALDTSDQRRGYRITSISKAWSATGRQKNMDAREFA